MHRRQAVSTPVEVRADLGTALRRRAFNGLADRRSPRRRSPRPLMSATEYDPVGRGGAPVVNGGAARHRTTRTAADQSTTIDISLGPLSAPVLQARHAPARTTARRSRVARGRPRSVQRMASPSNCRAPSSPPATASSKLAAERSPVPWPPGRWQPGWPPPHAGAQPPGRSRSGRAPATIAVRWSHSPKRHRAAASPTLRDASYASTGLDVLRLEWLGAATAHDEPALAPTGPPEYGDHSHTAGQGVAGPARARLCWPARRAATAPAPRPTRPVPRCSELWWVGDAGRGPADRVQVGHVQGPTPRPRPRATRSPCTTRTWSSRAGS